MGKQSGKDIDMEVIVGMGDMKIARGDNVLATYALGSCVGVCMYDDELGIGGMLHAMLPKSKEMMNLTNPERYVDTGIPKLYQFLCSHGARPGHIKAKVVGGAKMFEFRTSTGGEDIGAENVKQTHKILKELGIPLVWEVTGGKVGRTIHFEVSTQKIHIRSTDLTEEII